MPGIDPDHHAQLQEALDQVGTLPTAGRLLDGRCSFDGWDTPPDTLIGLLACDCTLQRVVGRRGALDVGRSQRLATPPNAAPDRARPAGAFLDCDRPASWCDAHHIIPYEIGGRTDLINLVLLCRKHHRKLHAKRPWVCVINQHTKLPEFYDPHGNRALPHHPEPPDHPTNPRPQPAADPDGRPPDSTGPPHEYERVA